MLTVAGLVVGAAAADETGAVWGLVVGQSLTSALWWVVFVRYLRRGRRSGAHRSGHEPAGEAVG